MAVKPIPDGYHTLTPYLTVRDAAAAIAFYEKAFGAKELYRLTTPDGGIGHAEIQIGDSRIMMSDENPAWGSKSPLTLGGTPGGLGMYVADCDAVFHQAVAAGATVRYPLTDQFWGDRSGSVIDPFGHAWTILTHKEEVPPEEMQSRMDAWMKSQGA